MIYSQLTFFDFQDAFQTMNRKDNFSYEALKALFDYYDNYDDVYELDVIAICCDWNEMSKEEVLKEYELESIEELADRTIVIYLDNGNVLFQVF